MELRKKFTSAEGDKERELDVKVRGLLDALFYVANKPIDLHKISRLLQLDIDNTKRILHRYMELFNNFMIGVKIVEKNDYYMLKVTDEYVNYVKRFMRPPPLTKKQLDILAYIYVKKTVRARDLRDLFGQRVYKDLKKFAKIGLITKRKERGELIISIRPEAEAMIYNDKRKKIIKENKL